MKKVIIYSLLASLSLILFMCNFTKYKYYNPISKKYESVNMQESKEYGVFLAEYLPEKDIYVFLGDTLIIQEIWIEKCWNSTNFWNEIESVQNPQICSTVYILFKNNISELFTWKSKYKIKNNYGVSGSEFNSIFLVTIGYHRQSQILDTLIYPVYKRNDSLDNMELIGEMRFFKKNE